MTDGDHYWIYHTDNLGNTIRLNEAASTNTAIPTFILASEIHVLDSETVFQSSVAGGITGFRDVFALDSNGQLLTYTQSFDDEILTKDSINISQQQIESFYRQLMVNDFGGFNGLRYLPKSGGADYRSVTLMGRAGQVAYADFIFSDLSPQLQAIAQSWEDLQAATPSISTTPADTPQTALPENIPTQVRTDLAAHLGVPADQITIQSHSRQTWSDGCLGLGGPAELCLAALTEGWQVEAVDTETSKTYVYRTSLNGDQIRREP